ncbi:HTH_Tnp_Tc3_2 domain-containing protein [Trichonephila clavipes]|uniref:HTH_Tnp_Tc3_2 domain-containing protein n=1 Tax=Trichonephila clavipes TaxID=2585209 RepID=A0A8X6V4I8_TRICX|nr:HTH_Tnp_Tc3_2 domain-containing protein [Trichonephila clavipes]
MVTVDFLHHENLPTWTGSNLQPLVQKASDKLTSPPSRRGKIEIIRSSYNYTDENSDAKIGWIVSKDPRQANHQLPAVGTSAMREIVSSLWKQFTETITVVCRPVQGHKRATTSTEDCYLRLLAKRDRSERVTQLFHILYNATGTLISQITITQRLNAGDLYAWHPVVCIPLTLNHKKDCLACCREHLSLTEDDWGQASVSVELRFNLERDSRRVLIWREP